MRTILLATVTLIGLTGLAAAQSNNTGSNGSETSTAVQTHTTPPGNTPSMASTNIPPASGGTQATRPTTTVKGNGSTGSIGYGDAVDSPGGTSTPH